MSIVLALALAAPALAQAPKAPAPVNLDPQSLQAFLANEVSTRQLVGLSLAVARDGKLLYAGAAGSSVLSPGQAAGPDTRFAVGSITKQFTSACILLLAEDGKLSLSDKVAKWYPRLTRASDITLLDLMNHVSGYTDYYPLDFVDRPMQKPIDADRLIEQFGTRRLDFEPGTRYSYSNTGFLILGRVVEKVSGETFGAFLQRRILSPLGMSQTVYEPEVRPGRSFAQGYVTFALGPPEIPVPEGRGWVGAAGAIYSTPSDMVRWDMALTGGKVLKPDSYRLMTTPRKLADGSSAGYGCGLAIATRNGTEVLTHNGAVAGFYALNTMIPASRSAVVLFSNLDSYDAVNAVYARLLASVLPQQKAPATPPAARKPTEEPAVPAIAGPPAAEAARLMFKSLQDGKVDRSLLGEEYSYFLTDAKIAGASGRLKPYGEPSKVEVESVAERGGMEVARTRLVFASGVLKGLMYRTPDGRIQQFFVSKE
ncbi:MAG: serine hydrolase domain-containing protein [Vicinamibacterales bacterium]